MKGPQYEKLDVLLIEEPVVDVFMQVPRVPNPGEDIVGGNFLTLPGGAVNFSIVGTRLGLKIAIMGVIGNDTPSEHIIKTLIEEKVDVSKLKIMFGSSTTCITVVDNQGERTFITIPGVGRKLLPDHISISDVNQANLIFTSGYSLTEPGISKASLKIMALANKTGREVFFDPATQVRLIANDVMKRALSYTDTLLLNHKEALIVSNTDNVESASRAFCQMGPKRVIIKTGKKGCVIREDGRYKEIPGYKVKAIDTTGAGDAFNAAFVTARLRGADLIEAAQFANIVGAIAVTKFGAGPNLPLLDEIHDFIKNRKLPKPAFI